MKILMVEKDNGKGKAAPAAKPPAKGFSKK